MNASNSPKFSILVPCLNPGQYIGPAIDSALNQLAGNDEIIVQDAGSTDGTLDYLSILAKKDSRVRLFSEPDDGQADALNRALGRATGEWTVWLNADDILLPGALDAVRAACANPAAQCDVVVGSHQILRESGDRVDTYAARALDKKTLLKVGCSVFSGSLVIRADLLRAIGGFDSGYHYGMDFELQLRMAEHNPGIAEVTVPIGALRFHDASKTATHGRYFIQECWRLRRQHSEGVGDYLASLQGEFMQVVAWPVFELRLTKPYRRFRNAVRRSGSAGQMVRQG
jgi:glycosyltransferase involved in cell wall biosynthesis